MDPRYPMPPPSSAGGGGGGGGGGGSGSGAAAAQTYMYHAELLVAAAAHAQAQAHAAASGGMQPAGSASMEAAHAAAMYGMAPPPPPMGGGWMMSYAGMQPQPLPPPPYGSPYGMPVRHHMSVPYGMAMGMQHAPHHPAASSYTTASYATAPYTDGMRDGGAGSAGGMEAYHHRHAGMYGMPSAYLPPSTYGMHAAPEAPPSMLQPSMPPPLAHVSTYHSVSSSGGSGGGGGGGGGGMGGGRGHMPSLLVPEQSPLLPAMPTGGSGSGPSSVVSRASRPVSVVRALPSSDSTPAFAASTVAAGHAAAANAAGGGSTAFGNLLPPGLGLESLLAAGAPTASTTAATEAHARASSDMLLSPYLRTLMTGAVAALLAPPRSSTAHAAAGARSGGSIRTSPLGPSLAGSASGGTLPPTSALFIPPPAAVSLNGAPLAPVARRYAAIVGVRMLRNGPAGGGPGGSGSQLLPVVSRRDRSASVATDISCGSGGSGGGWLGVGTLGAGAGGGGIGGGAGGAGGGDANPMLHPTAGAYEFLVQWAVPQVVHLAAARCISATGGVSVLPRGHVLAPESTSAVRDYAVVLAAHVLHPTTADAHAAQLAAAVASVPPLPVTIVSSWVPDADLAHDDLYTAACLLHALIPSPVAAAVAAAAPGATPADIRTAIATALTGWTPERVATTAAAAGMAIPAVMFKSGVGALRSTGLAAPANTLRQPPSATAAGGGGGGEADGGGDGAAAGGGAALRHHRRQMRTVTSSLALLPLGDRAHGGLPGAAARNLLAVRNRAAAVPVPLPSPASSTGDAGTGAGGGGPGGFPTTSLASSTSTPASSPPRAGGGGGFAPRGSSTGARSHTSRALSDAALAAATDAAAAAGDAAMVPWAALTAAAANLAESEGSRGSSDDEGGDGYGDDDGDDAGGERAGQVVHAQEPAGCSPPAPAAPAGRPSPPMLPPPVVTQATSRAFSSVPALRAVDVSGVMGAPGVRTTLPGTCYDFSPSSGGGGTTPMAADALISLLSPQVPACMLPSATNALPAVGGAVGGAGGGGGGRDVVGPDGRIVETVLRRSVTTASRGAGLAMQTLMGLPPSARASHAPPSTLSTSARSEGSGGTQASDARSAFSPGASPPANEALSALGRTLLHVHGHEVGWPEASGHGFEGVAAAAAAPHMYLVARSAPDVYQMRPTSHRSRAPAALPGHDAKRARVDDGSGCGPVAAVSTSMVADDGGGGGGGGGGGHGHSHADVRLPVLRLATMPAAVVAVRGMGDGPGLPAGGGGGDGQAPPAASPTQS